MIFIIISMMMMMMMKLYCDAHLTKSGFISHIEHDLHPFKDYPIIDCHPADDDHEFLGQAGGGGGGEGGEGGEGGGEGGGGGEASLCTAA